MRKAAGILIIVTAVIGFAFIRAIIGFPGSPPLQSDIPYCGKEGSSFGTKE